MINSLVAYKGKPSRIVSQNTHKFELEFADGSTRKVREKDFRFIHSEFIKVNESCTHADVAVLSDFQEETLTLQEITEWLFDEYTAQNAWCTCLLVEDGLYFYWQKDKIFVRPAEQVENIQAKRDAEALELKNLAHCIDNITNNIYDEQDLPYIQQIEKVALNQSKHTKILSAINIENTPEAAYKLLLRLKYFDPSFNPYPARFDVPKDEEIEVNSPEVDRTDLTHLHSYAIDNVGSTDADDAISIDGDKIWVHIADVSAIVVPGSDLDAYAQERASNLYLPEQILHMLPISITELCALGISETSNALSVGFVLEEGEINNIEVIRSLIKVTNISYDEADDFLDKNKHLSKLKAVVEAHKQYRDAHNAISLDLPNVDVRFRDDLVTITAQKSSQSRELIAEMMIMAGRAIAKFSVENDIVMPYAIQDEGDFPKETLDNKGSLTLSASFKATKCFKRSATSTKPLQHYGLGLEAYLRVTSPLRRYLDLLVHQQLSSFISGEKTLEKDKVKEIIGITNATMPDIGKTTRASNDHYKCLYLMQNPKWQSEGVVVDTRGDKALFMIPEIGMMTQIKFKTLPGLDEKVLLRVSSVDLVERSVNFQPV
ncbi:MAG: RNB domain-containing ribonuclease [Candidatus Thioglobus sp.]|uniref:ribonuclease catalytic domain-containing protein n=1 Tax=Candidatus Thioglobus sp. TaxID=2026721 RepID=UPI0001BD3795|nr:ribonuclease catalytic domain-containing protein [Candidatus Thioglobus sp.]EEZ80050.1 MAG: exoribonuclease R [uncultured Candidatus Thioglobus sp.]MBT3186642.1 RNB domain-containing ribonuclease [Candidatus Thioglobus sp.]MBT3965389.1 RNB domain-containing ribonuclease [Candidatus Thioglobus sp.]MBT4316159.1 RNB domain-containing ribonuclease [Candidatus Thioglobus sp.]MBT4552917.1 RNB domain-containing ribonuclease [Candidatus Thioglobus sp.]